jgi:hypothetical protein
MRAMFMVSRPLLPLSSEKELLALEGARHDHGERR